MLAEIVSFIIFAFGLVLFTMSIGAGRNLLKGMIYMSIGAAITIFIKLIFFDQRPCAGDILCPFDSGIVSGHTITSMMFAMAFYNKKEFIIFLGISMLVAYSRIYFGFHDLTQVARSIAITILAYYSLGVLTGGIDKKG
jgi:membrane-associated phospholipid phosphatase